MDSTHAETYKGFEIKVYVWRDVGDGEFVGMYEIYPRKSMAQRGIAKGGFVIAHDAEAEALRLAKAWVDAQ